MSRVEMKKKVLSENDLLAGSDSRMGLTQFFPDFSFRSPVMYQIRNTTAAGFGRKLDQRAR